MTRQSEPFRLFRFPSPTRWPDAYWLNCAGLLCALAYAQLAWHTRQAGAGLELLLSTSAFCALLVYAVYRRYRPWADFPVRSLLLWAVIFRVIGVGGEPILEDDFYRYLWDGRTTALTGAPYSGTPADHFTDDTLPHRFTGILDRVAYPTLPTVYGPLCQWLFAAAYWIAPGEVWPLQAAFAFMDMAVIVVLLRLAPARRVLLYAWNPLLIKEFAFTAHTDVMAVLLALLALYAWRKQRADTVGLLLALASGAKIFALLLAPCLLGRQWRAWAVFTLALLMLHLPFGVESFWPGGLQAMSQQWQFNAGLHSLLGQMMPATVVRVGTGLIFVAAWLAYSLTFVARESHHFPRGDWIFGGMLLLGPVLNPWYWVWVLPFAVVYCSRWAWTASVALLLSYVIGLNTGQAHAGLYAQPIWVLWLEYGLIAFAGLLDWRAARRTTST